MNYSLDIVFSNWMYMPLILAQAILCKLLVAGCIMTSYAIKIFHNHYATIGSSFYPTLFYGFAGSFNWLNGMFRIYPHIVAARESILSNIKNVNWAIAIILTHLEAILTALSLISLCVNMLGPITFLFDAHAKYSLANSVFLAEAGLFLVYLFFFQYFMFYHLRRELNHSITFLGANCQGLSGRSVQHAILTKQINKYTELSGDIYTFCVHESFAFTIAAGFRFALVKYPWLLFFSCSFEVLLTGILYGVTWQSYAADITKVTTPPTATEAATVGAVSGTFANSTRTREHRSQPSSSASSVAQVVPLSSSLGIGGLNLPETSSATVNVSWSKFDFKNQKTFLEATIVKKK